MMTPIDYGSLGRLGVLLPSGNQAAEAQFRALLPPGVSLHVTRLKLTDASEKALLGMADDLEAAASLLADARVDLILFHCTAVSTYSAELEASLVARAAAAAGIPVTATSRALTAALQALHARRIVMLSPYPQATHQREMAFFQSRGFEVLGSHGLECHSADEMMAITPERWRQLALDCAHPDAQAYMFSCTTVRTAEVVDELERDLGCPVVTSNTAGAWHCLRAMGVNVAVPGFGQLLAPPAMSAGTQAMA